MGCSVAKLFKFQIYIQAGIALAVSALCLMLGGCAGGTEGQNSTPTERSAQFTVESENAEGLPETLVEIIDIFTGETLAAGTTDQSGKAELKFLTADKVRVGYMLTRSNQEVSVDLGFANDTSEYTIVHRAIVTQDGQFKEFESQPATVKQKKRDPKDDQKSGLDEGQSESPGPDPGTDETDSPTPVSSASPVPSRPARPTPTPSSNPGEPQSSPTPQPENSPSPTPTPTNTPDPGTPTPTPSSPQNFEGLTEEEFMTLVVDQLVIKLVEAGCDETVFTTSQVANRVVPSCGNQGIVFSRSDAVLTTRAKVNECVAHVVSVSPYCS